MAETQFPAREDLQKALEENEFRAFYQPIVRLSDGKTVKAEALIRWQHPHRGLLVPHVFISVAERTRQIIEIGDWIFSEAARQLKIWQTAIDPAFQMSVNRSPVQFEAATNAQPLLDSLHQLAVAPSGLVLEITEGLMLNAEASVTKQLAELKQAGLQFALDDFGTGYSALSYLKSFRPAFLKIDRSFVTSLPTDDFDCALTEMIVRLSHRLGITTIAEGVETTAQQKFLAGCGCDFAQGYLFSKPVPPVEFEKLI